MKSELVAWYPSPLSFQMRRNSSTLVASAHLLCFLQAHLTCIRLGEQPAEYSCPIQILSSVTYLRCEHYSLPIP